MHVFLQLAHLTSTHNWVDDNNDEVANGNLALFEKKSEELQESVKAIAPGFHARLEQIKQEQEQAAKIAAEEAAKFQPEKRVSPSYILIPLPDLRFWLTQAVCPSRKRSLARRSRRSRRPARRRTRATLSSRSLTTRTP